VIGDAVIAFLGHSGSGKSTLAASFSAERPLMTDDCLALDVDGAAPFVVAHPSYLSLRLCRDAAEVLDHDLGRHAEVSPRMRWKVRVPFGAPPTSPLHLRAAYVLEPADGRPSIAPLRQRDAFMAFATYTHRLDPTDAPSLARETAVLRELALRVPVGRLAYPRRFEELTAVRALVEADALGKIAPVARPSP
jgi:hypothetical protein